MCVIVFAYISLVYPALLYPAVLLRADALYMCGLRVAALKKTVRVHTWAVRSLSACFHLSRPPAPSHPLPEPACHVALCLRSMDLMNEVLMSLCALNRSVVAPRAIEQHPIVCFSNAMCFNIDMLFR
jgi:hypothetical protein